MSVSLLACLLACMLAGLHGFFLVYKKHAQKASSRHEQMHPS